MPTCKCGNKKGWNDWECRECMQKQSREINKAHLETLRPTHPKLLAMAELYDSTGAEFASEDVRAELPEDSKILGYVSSTFVLFMLTPGSLLKIERTLMTGRVKEKETIPLGTITGFETKPPAKEGSLWTFRVTRAGNTDEFFIADEANVRPFIQQVNDAMSASFSGSSPSPGATPVTGEDIAEKIKSLASLRDSGLITEQEFEAKKAELIASL